MGLIKIAISKKQYMIERYLYRKYPSFVSAQYHHAITDPNAAINAASVIKKTLGKKGIAELKETIGRMR